MQKITIIIGLPWSWKSTYISNNSWFSKAIICDDYHKSSMNHSREFNDSIYFSDIKHGLIQKKDLVLADIAWCKKERLEAIINAISSLLDELQTEATIEYLYFENNPSACKANIIHRNRSERVERELEFIDSFSSLYHIPLNAVTIPIYTQTTA